MNLPRFPFLARCKYQGTYRWTGSVAPKCAIRTPRNGSIGSFSPASGDIVGTVGSVNRLATESSPYLRQHADNPVDWYPWGPEAMAEAAERDVPILLSVGYSACHWCHVMAHESFEDEATAGYMNEHFVNVKVDREERPDVDAVYMDAVQALTGRGGWPMTVFLTADGRPFYGGTYFPPTSTHGMPGFRRPPGRHRRRLDDPPRPNCSTRRAS